MPPGPSSDKVDNNDVHVHVVCGECAQCVPMCVCSHIYMCVHVPYLREKGPMGGAPYIQSRLGEGPIFEVSLSQLDAKGCPGKLPTQSSLFE